MKIILVSSDSGLRHLCMDILSGFEEPCHLATTTADNLPHDGDFYVWDGITGKDISRWLDRSAKHLFLVDRYQIESFTQKLGGCEANILLKPVTRASLAAFLAMAGASFQDRLHSTSSLRADRDEIFQCLIQSNLKLQEYDQDRTNFLARAVHDFRAPLTATCGYCGLLLSEALGTINEDQKEVLSRMQHSLKRLSRMASAMFELSVGRQMKRKPDFRPTDIRECVDQALHEVNPFAESKRITISVDLVPPPVLLSLEAGQIEQVLINLMDNACKFTSRGGEIDVRGYPTFWERRSQRHSLLQEAERRHSVSRAANAYRLDIRDSGAHIPREHLEKIFEEYTSYSGGKDRSGGGLGLAICRMIVTLHEGWVWGENTEQGPRFSVLIPLPQNLNGTELLDPESVHLSQIG